MKVKPLQKISAGLWQSNDKALEFCRIGSFWQIHVSRDCPKELWAKTHRRLLFVRQKSYKTLQEAVAAAQSEKVPLWEKPLELFPLSHTIGDLDGGKCWISHDRMLYICKKRAGWYLVFILAGQADKNIEGTRGPARLAEWKIRHGLDQPLPTRKDLLKRLEEAQKTDPLHELF